MRSCTDCGLELALVASNFRPQSQRPNLFHHQCRACENARAARRRAAAAALRPPKVRPTEKSCAKCGMVKPVAEFNKTTRGYARSRCKVCQGDDYRDYVSRNRDSVSLRTREYHAKTRFKMTLEEVDALHASAGYRCESCGKHRDDTYNQRLVLDHDHACCPGQYTCGQCVRGVLCTKCNVAFGALNDSVETVRALLAYVEGRA